MAIKRDQFHNDPAIKDITTGWIGGKQRIEDDIEKMAQSMGAHFTDHKSAVAKINKLEESIKDIKWRGNTNAPYIQTAIRLKEQEIAELKNSVPPEWLERMANDE